MEGAPNFRSTDMLSLFQRLSIPIPKPSPHLIYGVAMPTKDAIRNVLKRVNAGPGGSRKLLWTSLREEPVLFVNRKPYVLRMFQDPIKNLETTGIVRERVESMEARMKEDVLQEMRKYGGRFLLHEEETNANGFEIVVGLCFHNYN
jgi:hypothetical protein